MNNSVFHIFLNTPVGREDLLQTVFFAKRLGCALTVFIPTVDKCVMYFDHTVITIDLDESYLHDAETAADHVQDVLHASELPYGLFTPSSFTGGRLPDVPNDWEFLACPHLLGEKSNRIGLPHLGRRVRAILMHASFPVFVTAGAFKKWTSVAVLFSGSPHGINAVEIGQSIASRAGAPLTIITHLIQYSRADCERTLSAGVGNALQQNNTSWIVSGEGGLEESLYHVPHDSLVVVGTGQHSLMQELIRGNNLDKIQSMLPNPFVICGPLSHLA